MKNVPAAAFEEDVFFRFLLNPKETRVPIKSNHSIFTLSRASNVSVGKIWIDYPQLKLIQITQN